jgi:hypothetical protein
MPQMLAMFQARSGKVYARQLSSRGRVFNLEWHNKLKVESDYLRTWEAQYRNDFFSYQDIERGRYFSGRFIAPLEISPGAFDRWNLRGQFEEIPGLPLFAYPTNWGVDSIFIEERDGFGSDLVKLNNPAVWVYEVNGNAHGGANYYSNTTNETAEWVYFGYGFRFWSIKQPDGGIIELSLDGTVLTNVDLYSAGVVVSAALYTSANVKLGFHRVKVRLTGTKNAASTGFISRADAIEVMQ